MNENLYHRNSRLLSGFVTRTVIGIGVLLIPIVFILGLLNLLNS